jgi:hypothetical protein
LALAAGLKAAGHQITLSITSVDGKDYSDLARRLGIEARHTSYQRMTKEELRQFGREIQQTRNPSKHLLAVVSSLLEPSDEVVEEAARELCSHIDVAVGHSIIHALAAHAARSGCRYVSVQLQADGLPTRHRPPPGAPNLGPLSNRFLWWMASRVLDRIMTPRINEIGGRIGVGRVRSFLWEASHSAELNLVAASPSLV